VIIRVLCLQTGTFIIWKVLFLSFALLLSILKECYFSSGSHDSMDFGFKHCYYTVLLCSLSTGMFKRKQNAKKSLWADLSLNEQRNKFCILLHYNLFRTKHYTPNLAQYNRSCEHRRCSGNAMVPNGLSSQIQLTKIASAWYVRCASGIVLS
jgi:hypothetical protein